MEAKKGGIKNLLSSIPLGRPDTQAKTMLKCGNLSALNPNHCSHSLALITIFSGFKNNPNHHTQFLTLNTIHRSQFTISLAMKNFAHPLFPISPGGFRGVERFPEGNWISTIPFLGDGRKQSVMWALWKCSIARENEITFSREYKAPRVGRNFCGSIFLRIGWIFCVLWELIFAIRTDWFFSLRNNFCDFQKVSRTQHWQSFRFC